MKNDKVVDKMGSGSIIYLSTNLLFLDAGRHASIVTYLPDFLLPRNKFLYVTFLLLYISIIREELFRSDYVVYKLDRIRLRSSDVKCYFSEAFVPVEQREKALGNDKVSRIFILYSN